MPFNGTGTFVRLENWTNDANNNLPISATKFDIEDNDFASGLSLCLTRDGQGGPTGPLTWVQPLTINRATDGTGIAVGRTGGVNNPSVALSVADASGATLNLTTAQSLVLAIASTAVITIGAAAIALAQPATFAQAVTISAGELTVPNGTAGAPALNFAASATDGLYSVGAGDLGIAIAGVQSFDLQAGQLAALGAAGVAASLVVAGNGTAIANGLTMRQNAAGLAQFLLAGSEICNINSSRAWAFDAPTAGDTITATGLANNYAATLLGSSTSGQSYGLHIKAGSNISDAALIVQNQAVSATYLAVWGDGEITIDVPPAATNQDSTHLQVGYLDEVQRGFSSNTALVITDRGKCLITFTGSLTLTIPDHGTVPFPSGTIIRVMCLVGGTAPALTITVAAGSTDTLVWLPSGTSVTGSGSRTLSGFGACTLEKTATNQWIITGAGVA